MAFPSHKVAAGRGFVSVGLAQVGIAGRVRFSPTKTGGPETRHGSGSVRPPRPAPTVTSPQQRGARRPRTLPRPAIWACGSKQPSPTMTPTGTGWTAEATTLQHVMSQPTLSNAGYRSFPFSSATSTTGKPVTHRYAQPFTTGSHTRGYLLTAVRLALFKAAGTAGHGVGTEGSGVGTEGISVDGAWAVHANDAGKPAADAAFGCSPNPELRHRRGKTTRSRSLTHPDGVHLDPATKYWIVISKTNPDDGRRPRRRRFERMGLRAWRRA